ncbi:hypothetical protein XENORESO_004438 [Xenotaenia resolanae]|uniref:C-type lectin domain-containing protein n=1 Tax=Xenotaenia resolanae TaxID=208358 RepID=A0ABV0W9U4_9TELE
MTEIWLITRRTLPLFLIFASVIFTSPLEYSPFQLVTSKKKYKEAKSYCRGMYTDLCKFYKLAEINAMIDLVLKSADSVWIGLELGEQRIWHWTASNQGTSFLNWRIGEPKNTKTEACAAMDHNGTWVENDCGIPKSFVCQGSGDARNHIFVEYKKSWRDARSHCWGLSSDLVSIDSAEENKAIRNMSASEDVWIGLFKDPWTWSDDSNSSFRFWNASEPSYSDNRGCVAADLTNLGKWSSQNCNNTLSFICCNDNRLILIQKNMTWIAALSFCREHYIDLVQITNEDIQDKVAERAKGSTSPHVWLGLHYTCNFKFWFWTSSIAGCYQNWRPEEGPEGAYECGVSGAIEATGRQQWVGLPETKKLNFICQTCGG